MDIGSFHQPDASCAGWLEQVAEGHRPQWDRAFGHPAPPGIDDGDGEGSAQVAALLGPAAGARFERAVELGDLLADVPFWPARHVGPHLPDRVQVGFKHRLVLEQVHDRLRGSRHMRYALRLLVMIPPADSHRNRMEQPNGAEQADFTARFDTFQYRASDCLSVQSRSG